MHLSFAGDCLYVSPPTHSAPPRHPLKHPYLCNIWCHPTALPLSLVPARRCLCRLPLPSPWFSNSPIALFVCFTAGRSPPAGGQVHAKNARAGLVVRHPGRPDRDGEPVHDVQGARGGSVLSNVSATVVYSPMPSVGGQTPQRAVDLEPVRGSSRAVSRSRRNTRTWKFVCVE